MFSQQMPGTRLSYVVVKLEGTLKREVATWSKKEGITSKEIDVPAGFLVYFPRGHVLRIADMAHMEHYGFAEKGRLKKPKIINLAGLQDPESPLGKMMSAQDDAARAGAYQELEQMVMQLAIAKSGPVIMPEQVKQMRFVQHSDYTTKGRKASEQAQA